MSAQDDIDRGVALQQRGDHAGAEAAYRAALASEPTNSQARCNLGVALAAQNRFAEAETEYLAALEGDADNEDVLFNLGNAQRRQGRFEESAATFLRLLALKPGHTLGRVNLGICRMSLGRPDEAAVEFAEAARLDPDAPEAELYWAESLSRLGRVEESAQHFRRYTRLKPNDPKGYHNLALQLHRLDKGEEAAATARFALQIEPRYPECHNTLGVVLERLGRLPEAHECYARSVSLRNDLPEALNNLANAELAQGNHGAAVALRRMCLERSPATPAYHSSYLVALHHSGTSPLNELSELHRLWGRSHGDPLTPPPIARDPAKVDRLTVGYLSSDYRAGNPALGFEPLLKHRDRERVRGVAISCSGAPDRRTDELRVLCDDWLDISPLDDEQAMTAIRERGVDVLVDLTGHYAGNRLGLVARRPCALQVAFGGFPFTSGLMAIDARITDGVSDPEGADEYYVEKLVRLDGPSWCYAPPADAHDPRPSPMERNSGLVTFGCLASLTKLSDWMANVWAELLRQVPRSRLMVMAGRSGHGIARLRDLFGRLGVDPGRLIVVPKLAPEDALGAFGEIDVALDPYPLNAGPAAADALWMGVPTVTLAGHASASRRGLLVMYYAGLMDECVAVDAEEYVRKAAELAANGERLKEIRRDGREMIRGSELVDGAGLCARFEEAIRGLWLGGEPGESAT